MPDNFDSCLKDKFISALKVFTLSLKIDIFIASTILYIIKSIHFLSTHVNCQSAQKSAGQFVYIYVNRCVDKWGQLVYNNGVHK